jgi:Glycosyltransferase sugar-binding region containing DXD motif
MIFAYWHDTDHSPIRPFIAHWRAYFPEFRVVGDCEIEPLITRYFPEFANKYRAISIPACRANLARMLMLYEAGGLYVDCHCGIVDPVRTQALLDSATENVFTLFNKDLADGRPADQLWPLYSILVCRAGCPIVLDIAAAAIRNLTAHWRREASEDFSPYNIWEMCGTGSSRMSSSTAHRNRRVRGLTRVGKSDCFPKPIRRRSDATPSIPIGVPACIGARGKTASLFIAAIRPGGMPLTPSERASSNRCR